MGKTGLPTMNEVAGIVSGDPGPTRAHRSGQGASNDRGSDVPLCLSSRYPGGQIRTVPIRSNGWAARGMEGKSLHELRRPASAGPRCDSSLSKAEVTERDTGASGMTMMGLGVCCRLRNETWTSQFCETKPCATPRVGQDRRLSNALTLAVAHEQDSHDLGEREAMDLGFLGSFPRHRRRRTWRGSGVERPITSAGPGIMTTIRLTSLQAGASYGTQNPPVTPTWYVLGFLDD